MVEGLLERHFCCGRHYARGHGRVSIFLRPVHRFLGGVRRAAALGCLCLPAGGMTTTARLRFILDNNATVVCCTPTYALRMAEVAAEGRLDLARSAVKALIVAGEPGGSRSLIWRLTLSPPRIEMAISSGWIRKAL